MKKSFVVLGLGRFGLSLIEELSKHNVDVIGVDMNVDNVNLASEIINNVFICNTTSETALHELGINNVDHAFVAYGSNLQATIMTTIILKEMGIKKITVRVDDEYYAPVLKKLGADEVISPQKIAGRRLANKAISDNFIDYFDIKSDYGIVEISVTHDIKPMNIHTLDPRNNYDVNLLLIQRGNRLFSPKGTDDIMSDDHLFIFGTTPKISRFDQVINSLSKS